MANEERKPVAFVIQQFDGGRFDKRYQETIRPAVEKAGAVPNRADQILGLQPIIQKIEDAIRDADICIAEVSLDNPNVWLELGFALATDKPTVILCDKGIRERLPFDIQHRPVILYSTDSKSGYEDLEDRIVREVKNQLEAASRLKRTPVVQSGASDTKDLKGYEIAILSALLALWPASSNGVSSWDLQKKLGRSGYNETQIGLGITKLMAAGYVEQRMETDERDGYDYLGYRITPEGITWLHENEQAITPRESSAATFLDDDIPF